MVIGRLLLLASVKERSIVGICGSGPVPFLRLLPVPALGRQKAGKKLSIKSPTSAEHNVHHGVVKNTGAVQAVP